MSFQAWLKTVAYPANCLEIPSKVITDTLRHVYLSTFSETEIRLLLIEGVSSVLEKAGVVKAPQGGFALDDFVHTEVVKLT